MFAAWFFKQLENVYAIFFIIKYSQSIGFLPLNVPVESSIGILHFFYVMQTITPYEKL